MDPVNPWLDPVEVRRLAERLIRPVRDTALTVSDAGFDDAFVGYAAGRPSAPASPAPAAAQAIPARVVAPAEEPPPLPPRPATPPPQAPAPAATAPVQQATTTVRGPFLDRIQRFRDWMHHHFAASGIFILDREGAVIFDESHHGRLHFLARSLALASRRPGSTTNNVHVKIGAAATLEVIPVDTAYGTLVLGAVVPEALQPNAVSAVMEALSQVAAPPAEV
jgi:hypothetical protein